MRGHACVIEFSNSELPRLRLISVWFLDNSTVKHRLSTFSVLVGLIQLFSQPTVSNFLRKEVIQPHLPIRLPCYDFTPVIGPAFGSSSLKG